MPTEKRERQRANREAAKAKRERDAKRAKLRSNVIRFGGVAVAVIVAGFLLSRGADEPTTTTVAPGTPAATAAATTAAPTTTTQTTEEASMEPVTTPEYEALRALPVACGGELPPPATAMSFDAPEDQGLSGQVRVTLRTSCGDLVLSLDADTAPQTVNSFVFLARQGFFDGTASHRIVPGFVYQAGDPTGRGSGGPGYRFEDELPAGDFVYTRGTLAMANSGPNTNGSQFFIVFQDTQLPPAYSVFGTVESGLDVLDKIESVTVAGQQPMEAVFIENVIVEG